MTWLNYITDTSRNKHQGLIHEIHKWIHSEVTYTSTCYMSKYLLLFFPVNHDPLIVTPTTSTPSRYLFIVFFYFIMHMICTFSFILHNWCYLFLLLLFINTISFCIELQLRHLFIHKEDHYFHQERHFRLFNYPRIVLIQYLYLCCLLLFVKEHISNLCMCNYFHFWWNCN